MNISVFLQKFAYFCKEKQFIPKKSVGLLSPVFPHEFNVSGGHNYAMEILEAQSPIRPETRYSLVERCFRRIDMERVGYSNSHLSFYQVALFTYGGTKDIISRIADEAVANTLYFLTEILGIPKDNLVITFFTGGRIKNFQLQEENLFQAWARDGFPQDKLIGVKGRRNFIFTESEGSAACPTCEIYFDRGQQFDNLNRFVEIGSTNLYKYLYLKNNLFSTENWVLNTIFGIERICMVKQGVKSIYDIDTIVPLVKTVEKYLGTSMANEIFIPSIRTIADRATSIAFICSEGIAVDSSGRGRILKKLVKSLISQIRYLHIYNPKIFEDMIEKIAAIYGETYPVLKRKKDDAIQLIMKETKEILDEQI